SMICYVPFLDASRYMAGRGTSAMDKREIEQALRDYHWMVKEIARLRDILDDAGEGITRQYGVESGQPKPKGSVGDPVYMEVVRREKQWKRLEKLENKARLIQERIDLITDEREKTVLDCMLDGMSVIAISRHMGLSRRHIHRLKDSIVDKMAEMSQMEQMSHLAQRSQYLHE